jgi:HemY protein
MQGAEFAVQLTQAELQLVHGQLEQSLATLMQLQAKTPKHPHVLYLLARIYESLRSWGDLKSLLPDLRKARAMSEDNLQALEVRVHRELMTLATHKGKLENLRDEWQQVPKKMRTDNELLHHYILCLLTLDGHDDAEVLIRDSIKRNWSNQLAYLYGVINAKDHDRQLASAEGWLKGHEKNPVLLLTLGRLCMRNKLWGKARSYLEASIGIAPRSDSYKELGNLMEKLEEPDNAAKYFRQGLMLAAEEKIDDMLSITAAKLPQLPAII